MTFFVAKLMGWLLTPSNLLVVLVAFGLLIGARATPIGILRLALCVTLLACAFLPVGSWLLGPLENRFARPAELPARVDGIIVLGGAMRARLSVARDEASTNEYAERMTAGLMLARRYPEARLVFTGGDASLGRTRATEAGAAARWFAEAGLDPERITFESESRTTAENAVLTRRLVQPQAGEAWMLVTSAFHMPRAVGAFRAAGWAVLPWPVDYQTSAAWRLDGLPLASGNLGQLDLAAHEWLGLAFYRLSGRSDAFLPGP